MKTYATNRRLDCDTLELAECALARAAALRAEIRALRERVRLARLPRAL